MNKVTITEYLSIDLLKEMWCCNRCDAELISGKEPYFKGCLVYERPAAEIYNESYQVAPGQTVTYGVNPMFNRILEFYCPQCGSMLEVQYLPPGHPIPVDISLDLSKLKEKYLEE